MCCAALRCDGASALCCCVALWRGAGRGVAARRVARRGAMRGGVMLCDVVASYRVASRRGAV